MIISFATQAFEDFQAWAKTDKKVFSKIGTLIKEISRSPFIGLGKLEALKHDLAGYWSRRITDEHRQVYKVEKDAIYIISCKYHYEK